MVVLCSSAVPLRTSLSVQMVEGLPAPFPPLPAGIPLQVGEGAGGTGHCAPHLGGTTDTTCKPGLASSWNRVLFIFYFYFHSQALPVPCSGTIACVCPAFFSISRSRGDRWEAGLGFGAACSLAVTDGLGSPGPITRGCFCAGGDAGSASKSEL